MARQWEKPIRQSGRVSTSLIQRRRVKSPTLNGANRREEAVVFSCRDTARSELVLCLFAMRPSTATEPGMLVVGIAQRATLNLRQMQRRRKKSRDASYLIALLCRRFLISPFAHYAAPQSFDLSAP